MDGTEKDLPDISVVADTTKALSEYIDQCDDTLTLLQLRDYAHKAAALFTQLEQYANTKHRVRMHRLG